MIKGIFCHDLPIYKDIKGFYGCTTLTDTVFGRYLELVDELVVATRLYHLDCTLEEANQEKITLPGLKFLDIPNLNKPQYYLTRLPKARKLIEDEFKTCDLVFIRGGTIADIGAGLARKYNKPYMCECGGCAWDNWWNYSFLGKMIAPWSELIVKRTIKNAAFVTYVTENWLQVRYPTNGQAQGISDVVIEDVSNDILVRRLDKIQHRKSDEPWVIGTAAGLVTKCKGQQFVIEAIADLKNTMNIRYELAGTGDPSYLLSVARKYGIMDQVVIKGELTHEEVLNWMDSLDTYIQPSMTEGLPRALMEAMSRACPCIGSTAGGIPELLEKDAIFSKGNVGELKSILKAFYNGDWTMHSRFNHTKAKQFQKNLLDEKRIKFYGEYKEYALNMAKHE